jgi:hypothetical protein
MKRLDSRYLWRDPLRFAQIGYPLNQVISGSRLVSSEKEW